MTCALETNVRLRPHVRELFLEGLCAHTEHELRARLRWVLGFHHRNHKDGRMEAMRVRSRNAFCLWVYFYASVFALRGKFSKAVPPIVVVVAVVVVVVILVCEKKHTIRVRIVVFRYVRSRLARAAIRASIRAMRTYCHTWSDGSRRRMYAQNICVKLCFCAPELNLNRSQINTSINQRMPTESNWYSIMRFAALANGEQLSWVTKPILMNDRQTHDGNTYTANIPRKRNYHTHHMGLPHAQHTLH